MLKQINMKILALSLICALFVAVSGYGADGGQDDLERVLSSAESFFKSLKKGNYSQTWSMLSDRSKETITDDIYKGTNSEYSKQQIASDLKAGGMIAGSYWKGVLQSFDPTSVLEESKWEVGSVRPDKADLLITHRKSKNPAQLQMFKESGGWKVGLVESFWVMKR